jgi:hypothetical protein
MPRMRHVFEISREGQAHRLLPRRYLQKILGNLYEQKAEVNQQNENRK